MNKIELLLGASILLLASSVQASTIRTAITINGMDWAQLRDTSDLAGAEVYALCGLSATCNGVTQSGIDLTGWTWAEKEQVVSLVNDVLGSSWDGTGDSILGDASRWFEFFDGTVGFAGGIGAEGIYRFESFTVVDSQFPMPSIELLACNQPESFPDCGTYDEVRLDTAEGFRWATGADDPDFHGYYLYQPTVVPVPAAAWLFGTALIGLVGFSKRRKAA